MSEQLLFHEKCNSDVRNILDSLNHRLVESPQLKKDFLLRLTEAYQLIFESPTVNSGTIYEPDTRWDQRIDKKIIKVFDFPYLVVYTYLSKKTTVILGIISSITQPMPPQ